MNRSRFLATPTSVGSVKEIHRSSTLVVWAGYDDHGRLAIEGQDLGGHPMCDEYEYFIHVAPAQFPQLCQALGGGEDDDVLALLAGRGPEVVRAGETSWLRANGVPFDFDSRMGFH